MPSVAPCLRDYGGLKVALLRPAVAGLRRVSGGRGDGGLVLA